MSREALRSLLARALCEGKQGDMKQQPDDWKTLVRDVGKEMGGALVLFAIIVAWAILIMAM